MKNNLKAHIALAAANLLFGMNYPIAKSLMPFYMKPMDIIFFRAGVSAFLFWIMSSFFFKEKTEKKDLAKLALCGLLGISINQPMFFEGLNLTTPVDASIIMVLNPIMVLIFSALLIHEKINLQKIIGIGLGGCGAVITILYGSKISTGSNPVLGNFLIFTNALTYGLYLVIVKPLMMKYNAFTVMKWTFLFGFIFILPLSYNAAFDTHWSSFTGNIWFSLFYVVIGTTFFTYLLIAFSMKHVNPTVASFYIYFQPVISGIFSVILFDEKINTIKILSALMIFAGVYFISKKSNIKASA